jgi:hypothetical protein
MRPIPVKGFRSPDPVRSFRFVEVFSFGAGFGDLLGGGRL